MSADEWDKTKETTDRVLGFVGLKLFDTEESLGETAVAATDMSTEIAQSATVSREAVTEMGTIVISAHAAHGGV